jgi:hypothetical protein
MKPKIISILLSILLFIVITSGVQSFAQTTPTPPAKLLAAQKKVPVNLPNELFQYILKDGVSEEEKAEIKDGLASEYISVKPIDLNNDGEPEYIVEGLKPPLMGMLAGNIWIYKKKTGSYFLIGDIGSFENVIPISTKHNGYMDIQVSLNLNAGRTKVQSKFVFNGSKYVLMK